jgi:hypothetical protein|tara:strand:- start:816 stop:1220 length:405 start_codon:yes stop_codon:yes gene_type:complete
MRKRKLESIDKLLLFALVLFTFMFCNSLNAQKRVGMDTPYENIYGEWLSHDGDHQLFLNYTDDGDTFYRKSPEGIHTGDFRVADRFLVVTKKKESYKLEFYLKGMQLIVVKPESEVSEGDAWLFRKVSEMQTEY